MTERPNLVAAVDTERAITLGVLTAVQGDKKVTQRSVAKELGIALGLANAYLKRCIKKGFIKVSQVPPNRYAYYLTPRGFAEKGRLTAEFLSQSFLFFREAREQYGAIMAECAERGWIRIAFCGSGDLAEIAGLCTKDFPVTVAGIVEGMNDADGAGSLAQSLGRLGSLDAVVVTDMRAPQATFDALAGRLPSARVLTPELLGVARSRPDLVE